MFTDKIQFWTKAIVVHPDDDTLLLGIQRTLDDDSRPGDRDMPGGNIDRPETHEQGLRREIQEEVGLDVGKIYIMQQDTVFDSKQETYHIYQRCICRALSEDIVLSDEHIGWEWLDAEKFYSLVEADWVKEIVYCDTKELLMKLI